MEKLNFIDFRAGLEKLNAEPIAASEFADRYLAANLGSFPIIEGNTVHFLYKAQPGNQAAIAGEWNGFNPWPALMKPIGGGLSHYEHNFPLDARLDYLVYEMPESQQQQYSLAGQNPEGNTYSKRDPLNPRTGESGFGLRSELAMPQYRRPASTLEQPGVVRGKLISSSLSSRALNEERSYTIYLPAGYREDATPYPGAYFHDGNDYLTMGKAPIILDNLIASGTIPSIIAVFAPPLKRDKEYNCNPKYLDFFANELVPEMQSRYHLANDPAKRAIIGPSLGGLISLFIAAKRPDLFGLVGVQSSGVKPFDGSPFDARLDYATQPPLPLKLHLIIGSYENCFNTDAQGRCRDLLSPMREFQQVIDKAGYTYQYNEYPQGHSWGLWRDYLAKTLSYFFTTQS